MPLKKSAKQSKKMKNTPKRSKPVSRKKNTPLSKRSLLLFVLMGFAVFLTLLFYLIPSRPIQSGFPSLLETAVASPNQVQVSFGVPKRLKIPKIKVDAAVDSVGLTRQGAVGVPKGPSTVAWFNLGPRPGENGSAVLTGHFGPWVNGKRSVFDNLYKLRKGDKLSIIDDKGATITFVVREIRSYTQNAQATEVFNVSDGKAHLNLITCAGVWNKRTKLYSKRLVVFTDLLEEQIKK